MSNMISQTIVVLVVVIVVEVMVGVIAKGILRMSNIRSEFLGFL